jgi:hypothetical protein
MGTLPEKPVSEKADLEKAVSERPSDENLPEVVTSRPLHVDSSPQLATAEKADYDWQTADRDKYPVIFDSTPKFPDDGSNPKIPDDTPIATWSSADGNTITTQTTLVPWDSLKAGSSPGTPPPKEDENPHRICGLRRRAFFITLTLATLIILAASIAGGIAGSRAHSSPQPSPPLFLNNGTAPRGLAFQAFSEPHYGGNATKVMQEEGFFDIGERRSYVWLPDDTRCCLTFCKDKETSVGWWCATRYRANASDVFSRVYIWCGGNDGVKNETCS